MKFRKEHCLVEFLKEWMEMKTAPCPICGKNGAGEGLELERLEISEIYGSSAVVTFFFNFQCDCGEDLVVKREFDCSWRFPTYGMIRENRHRTGCPYSDGFADAEKHHYTNPDMWQNNGGKDKDFQKARKAIEEDVPGKMGRTET